MDQTNHPSPYEPRAPYDSQQPVNPYKPQDRPFAPTQVYAEPITGGGSQAPIVPARHRSRRGLRGLFQVIALVAVLVVGIAALNWPITFETQSPDSAANNATAQTLLAPEDNGSDSTAVDATVAEVAAKANPAVVTITNYRNQVDPRTGEAMTGDPVAYGVGSGYIIDEDGHVVTNQHVTDGGVAFTVEFYDKTTVNATLVGSDPFQDVAVLKLDLDPGETVPGTLNFGDSSTVRAGDHVIAIGSPYGEFLNSVSDGSVAAVDRVLESENGLPLSNLIQHSAPIYEGNSGGPLLNMSGQVIGMNVAKLTQSSRGVASDDQAGIGFAIESDAVQTIVNQIIEKGTVSRAYLGIATESTSNQGISVESVTTDGPADQAGLQAGDVITAIDGTSVSTSSDFLKALVFDHAPGDSVEITVLRNGKELTLTATLGERPANLV